MNEKEIIETVKNVKKGLVCFLDNQRGENNKGYYRYSYSSDIYHENTHWNVGSSSFALKMMFLLGYSSDDKSVKSAADYICSFIHPNGLIYDDHIRNAVWNPKAVLRSIIKEGRLEIKNVDYIRAETRQCYSSLMAFDIVPTVRSIERFPFFKQPYEIINELEKKDWSKPWGAGSHFSHYMFFIKLRFFFGLITKEDYEEWTGNLIAWINQKCNKRDGCWYTGEPSRQEKINGAMKIISGMRTVNNIIICYPRELIDMCLGEIKERGHACDNFNDIYVLYHANKLDPLYRYEEIKEFAVTMFDKYMKYYKSDQCGFSFFYNKCNDYYYGKRITKAKNEADIHGTALFMWGISFISRLLGLNDYLDIDLKEIVT